VFTLLSIAGSIVYCAFVFSAWAIQIRRGLGRELPTLARTIYHETRPFYWASVAAIWAPDWYDKGVLAFLLNWLHYLWLVCYYVNWRMMKDVDDDDRWKRRRRKLAEAVKRVGDRLVVVAPVPVRA
jgi:hypothetical protein